LDYHPDRGCVVTAQSNFITKRALWEEQKKNFVGLKSIVVHSNLHALACRFHLLWRS
jgi:hypothetical protein